MGGPMKRDEAIRALLPFLITLIFIFLMAAFSWDFISRLFARLGLVPPIVITAEQREFTYTIPSSNLIAGRVVGYYTIANDSAGNVNMTNMTEPIRTFLVIYPEEIINIQILNSSFLPSASISQGSDFWVNVTINNLRTSDVSPLVTIQIINPDGSVTEPLAGNRQDTHQPSELVSTQQLYHTVDLSTGTYTAEARVITDWARTGFKIAYTQNTTFDIV